MNKGIVQLGKDTVVRDECVLFLFKIFADEGFSFYYDLKIKDIKDFYYRSFYYADDKGLLLNALSHFNADLVDMSDLDFKVELDIFNNINWTRLMFMLDLAEKENLSIFSTFYSWFNSSHQETMLISEGEKEGFDELGVLMKKVLEDYEDADTDYIEDYKK